MTPWEHLELNLHAWVNNLWPKHMMTLPPRQASKLQAQGLHLAAKVDLSAHHKYSFLIAMFISFEDSILSIRVKQIARNIMVWYRKVFESSEAKSYSGRCHWECESVTRLHKIRGRFERMLKLWSPLNVQPFSFFILKLHSQLPRLLPCKFRWTRTC